MPLSVTSLVSGLCYIIQPQSLDLNVGGNCGNCGNFPHLPLEGEDAGFAGLVAADCVAGGRVGCSDASGRVGEGTASLMYI